MFVNLSLFVFLCCSFFFLVFLTCSSNFLWPLTFAHHLLQTILLSHYLFLDSLCHFILARKPISPTGFFSYKLLSPSPLTPPIFLIHLLIHVYYSSSVFLQEFHFLSILPSVLQRRCNLSHSYLSYRSPPSNQMPALSHQTGSSLSTLLKLLLVFVSPTRFPSLFYFPRLIRLPLVSSFSHPTSVLSYFLGLPCSTPTKTEVPTRSSTKFDCANATKTEKHERRHRNEYNRATDKAKAWRIEKVACK